MKKSIIQLPILVKRVLLSALLVLSVIPGLLAQRGVRVPVPQGGGNIFPDWLIIVIIVVIALIIVVKLLSWLISCFRSWNAFLELLILIGGTGAAWLFWQNTSWAFGWCLLAAYASMVIVFGSISFHKQFTKRN